MTQNTIPHALRTIQQRIKDATQKAHRAEKSVSLIAVSKFHPQSSVIEALHAGQRRFGENRVQEAAQKFPTLRGKWPDITLHLIGSLQTNKAVEACRIADVIESLDRSSLSTALLKASQKTGRLPELMIQVNTGNEPQKSGILLKDSSAFIDENLKIFGHHIKGLMAIPPQGEDPIPHFRTLSDLAQKHGLERLSMGMSADFEDAIQEGSHFVRVGSAIFGNRPSTLMP